MPELSGKRRLHGGTESASGGRVKAVSRASGGAKAPALTRRSDADTLQPRNSNLTAKTVASPGGRREAVARPSASPVPDAIIRTAAACPRRTPRRANDGRPSAADARRGPRAGIVRLNSILPAGAPARDGAPLFLLRNRRHARRDSTPKMTYTNLP